MFAVLRDSWIRASNSLIIPHKLFQTGFSLSHKRSQIKATSSTDSKKQVSATVCSIEQVVPRNQVGQGGLPPLASCEVLEPLTDKAGNSEFEHGVEGTQADSPPDMHIDIGAGGNKKPHMHEEARNASGNEAVLGTV
eukprot:1140438-Pelagomonas_calceolata.AAC.4